MRTLLHIVPRMPPLIDGIGDYAALLGAELERQFGVRNLFLSTDSRQKPGGNLFVARECADFVPQDIQFDDLVLHYSGYGYHPRGVPFWLLAELKRFVRDRAQSFSVIFHEVWASGTPFQTAFYLLPFQRRIVRQLFKIAAHSFTSTPIMARLISPRPSAVEIIPIPSNISPGSRRVLDQNEQRDVRGLRLAVFGQEQTRASSVRAHELLLREAEGAGAISSVTLVGSGACPGSVDWQQLSRTISPDKIKGLPDAPPEDVAAVFASSDVALSFYPRHLLTKSCSVMAAFACDCPVLIPAASGGDEELFDPEAPVLALAGQGQAAELVRLWCAGDLTRTATRARHWYEENASWPKVGARFGGVLGLNARQTASNTSAVFA